MKPRPFMGQGRRCGRPTPKGPCKARIESHAIRCHRHMPKTDEEKAEYRVEMRALRNDDTIRDEAKFTRLTFASKALEYGLSDERTIAAFDAAKRAADDLKKQIERHRAEMSQAVKPRP